MDTQKVDGRNCPGCGGQLQARAAETEGFDWCSRCAMVDELIEELIRRQMREGFSPPPRSRAPDSISAG